MLDNFYLMKGDGEVKAQGDKSMTSKERTTAKICTTAAGTLFCPPAIVCASVAPKCFKGKGTQLPLPCTAQANAWVDTQVAAW
eukprot:m.529529 g.529529  ORF g.529529 m.529529 type:complete len:83 (+) comp57563_c0_seq71:148-396(+)